MNKDQFLKGFAPQAKTIKLDNGEVEINELTLEQRSKLHKVIAKDPVGAPAMIVCLGCSLFTEKDLPEIQALGGKAIAEISDAILELSGLADPEEAEKN